MSTQSPGAIAPAPHVFAHGGHAVTTSLAVADYFGKQHRDVLKKIRVLIEELSPEDNARNFAPVEIVDAKGEKRPAYEITQRGFVLLAMGFTGSKALAFKLRYIDAFEAMETQLLAPALPEPPKPLHPTASAQSRTEDQAQGEFLELQIDILEQAAQKTLAGCRELWAWRDTAQARPFSAAKPGSRRYLLTFDADGRERLEPLPPQSCVVDPASPEDMCSLLRDRVPAKLMFALAMTCVIQLDQLAKPQPESDSNPNEAAP